jgi:UDP-glucose 4-epimerase
MRALVTGGAGYIGSHLVDRLLADGYEVVVLDDLSVGKMANIEHHLEDRRFRFIEGSVLNQSLVREALLDYDLIFHLAAVMGIPYIIDDPLRGILINVVGTEVVLEMAEEAGCRFIFASSSEIYGKSEKMPLSEDDDRLLGSTRISRWSYSTAKALDEHLVLAYHQKRELPVIILRYFNSYGPRLDPQGYGSVVAKFIGQALRGEPLTVHGDGRQTRSFTYIDDTVEGTLLAAKCEEANSEAFNIGREEETTILQLAEMVKKITGSSSQIIFVPYDDLYGSNFEDPRRRLPDASKAERLLGFRAQVPLAEGLKKTVAWFRENYPCGGRREVWGS